MYRLAIPALMCCCSYAMAQTKNELFSRDSALLRQELINMHYRDQLYRKNSHTYKDNIKTQDSIDDANTTRMIAIINAYGFPSAERFVQKPLALSPHIMLVHAPDKYHDSLKILISSEREAKRINSFEYAHVMWHLNGRKDIPQVEGVKVKKRRGKTIMKY